MDGGTLTLGDDEARALVAKALSCVPADVADKVVDECCFVMPRAAQKGFVVPRELTDCRTIIGLHDSIVDDPEHVAVFTVLHEVAHHYLGHKVGLLEDMTKEDDVRQEEEANHQAQEWLDAAGVPPPA